jgi:dCMP deaminase
MRHYSIVIDAQRSGCDLISSKWLLNKFVQRHGTMTLDAFVQEHDTLTYGTMFQLSDSPTIGHRHSSLHSLRDLVNVHIVNSFSSLSALHVYLDSLDLLNSERLRPSWDTYFMVFRLLVSLSLLCSSPTAQTMASLASRRSNCMKRRVGAILVRKNRIVSTGFVDYPHWTWNELFILTTAIMEHRVVSQTAMKGVVLDAIVVGLKSAFACMLKKMHYLRLVGIGWEMAAFYIATRWWSLPLNSRTQLLAFRCPCLKCTVKIIQTGVREVVYNLSYKV